MRVSCCEVKSIRVRTRCGNVQNTFKQIQNKWNRVFTASIPKVNRKISELSVSRQVFDSFRLFCSFVLSFDVWTREFSFIHASLFWQQLFWRRIVNFTTKDLFRESLNLPSRVVSAEGKGERGTGLFYINRIFLYTWHRQGIRTVVFERFESYVHFPCNEIT